MTFKPIKAVLEIWYDEKKPTIEWQCFEHVDVAKQVEEEMSKKHKTRLNIIYDTWLFCLKENNEENTLLHVDSISRVDSPN